MNKYLLVSPDRYGRFGHQTTSIFAGLILANITKTKLIAPRYSYFCDKWNKYSDFSKSKNVASTISEVASIYFLEKNTTDEYGNRKWDLTDKNEIVDIINKIYQVSDNTLINLPFDQSAGLFLNLLNKDEVREDVRRIFAFPDRSVSPPFPYACVHIRRGDCTRNAHPRWYVDDYFYISLLQLILSTLPDEFKVYVCTQGDIAWLNTSKLSIALTSGRLVIRSTNQLFINDSEIDDFILMKNSSFLFSAASSFSHWASFLGRHSLIVDISRSQYHALNDVVIINPDNALPENLSRIREALNISKAC